MTKRGGRLPKLVSASAPFLKMIPQRVVKPSINVQPSCKRTLGTRGEGGLILCFVSHSSTSIAPEALHERETRAFRGRYYTAVYEHPS